MMTATSRIGLLQVVYPSQSHWFIFYATAPLTDEPCDLSLRMVEEFVEFFGPTLSVTINVVTPPNAAQDWERYE
jgi:hypothetical protein